VPSPSTVGAEWTQLDVAWLHSSFPSELNAQSDASAPLEETDSDRRALSTRAPPRASTDSQASPCFTPARETECDDADYRAPLAAALLALEGIPLDALQAALLGQ
jgi:hypothetical protein